MRILYGVTGEGLGHVMRSRLVIHELIRRGHHVKIAASGRAAGLLARSFSEVIPIRGLSIAYRDGTMARGRTVLENLRAAPALVRENVDRYDAEVRGFDPDLAISDFDSFAHLYAKTHRRPVIALDHQHVLDRCVHPKAVKRHLSAGFGVARAFVRAKMPGCACYVVPSFFFPSPRRRDSARTRLIPPILRPEIRAARATIGDEVLVYQTSATSDSLLHALRALPEHRFVIYGMGDQPSAANLRFARFDERAFIADLARARAVIANGGFTTLSEALFLQKPVLSIPVMGQHEQELNAAYLDVLGYGARASAPDPAEIRRFLDRADEYREALAGAPIRGGDEAVTAICDEVVEGRTGEDT